MHSGLNVFRLYCENINNTEVRKEFDFHIGTEGWVLLASEMASAAVKSQAKRILSASALKQAYYDHREEIGG